MVNNNWLTMMNHGMIWDLPSGKLRVCELENGHLY